MDFELETHVRKAMQKIVPVIRTNLEIVKNQPPPGWDWWDMNSDDSQLEPSNEPVVEEKQIEEPLNEPPQPAESEIMTENIPETKQEDTSLFLSLAGAPLVSTGEATEYFSLGSHLSLFGGFHLLTRPIDLVIGARFSWDHFTGSGLLTSSTNNFYYFGPEVQLGLGVDYGGRLFVRLSTGMSYFTVNAQHIDLNYTILPYLSMGAGAEIPLSEKFAVYYSGDYTFHFEKSTVFSGFYPTLGVCFSL